MNQQEAQLGENTEREDHTSSPLHHQSHEATPEAQQSPLTQEIEEDWPDETDAQDANPPTSNEGSQEEQKPPLSKKEKLLAKRAKLDAQIKREEEKERKERTHRLCILAGTILRVEKYEDNLKNLMLKRDEYELTDEEFNNISYWLDKYKD